MDIYEMGGGDSLFDAIDKGIRNCKVVVSHVTSKYALSANCRREISLSDALKKPIIPLLLDNTTWPPEGPMSLVFTQLLYIDFKDNNAVPQQLWSGSRFDQLIAKIDGYLGRSGNNSVSRPASAKTSNTANPTLVTTSTPPPTKPHNMTKPTDNNSPKNGAVHQSSEPLAKPAAPNNNETSLGQTSAKTADSVNKPVDNSNNKPANNSVNNPVANSVNKPVDNSDNKPANNSVNKPVANSDYKPANNSDNKPVDNGDNKPANNSDNKPIARSCNIV